MNNQMQDINRISHSEINGITNLSQNNPVNSNGSGQNNSSVIPLNVNGHQLNITKMFLHPLNRSAARSLRSRAIIICRNMMSEAYVKKSFSSFTGGYEYINPYGLRIGLVLWEELHVGDYNATVKGLTYIHILLICADVEYTGLGKGILDDVYSYATMVNAAYIELIPLNDRLSLYYEENGYVKGDTPKFMKRIIEPSFRLASSNGKELKEG